MRKTRAELMVTESYATNHKLLSLDVRGALREGMARLREADTPSHALAAELLLMHVLGRDRAWLYAHPEAAIDAATSQRYFVLIAQRAAGAPTQYLTGKREFWGLEFEVTPDVLIPRPETEHIVEVALERIGALNWCEELARKRRGHGLRIADVGTGSGCLAIALAHELPAAAFFATDISEAALAVARRNAERLRMTSRITFLQSNLLDALSHESRSFDLIVSNPPYIRSGELPALQREVRYHEPAQALFGGARGTEVYAPLISQSEKLLRAGGVVVVELGYDSLGAVRPLVETPAWTDVRVTNDLAGIPRVLSALRT